MSNISDESVYVILINDDNTMTATQKRRIVQRSKLVDDLWFLVRPEYHGYSMADFTVSLEYVLPVSRRYCNELLTLSSDTYNGYLKYTLPVDTNITAEAGDIEIQITFLMTEINENGTSTHRVRKILGTTITVTSIKAWSDIIPDGALTALDQRIIKTDAQIRALADALTILDASKADDIAYDPITNELQLKSDGELIGSKVELSISSVSLKDGVPVVEFSDAGIDPNDPDGDNVIEF